MNLFEVSNCDRVYWHIFSYFNSFLPIPLVLPDSSIVVQPKLPLAARLGFCWGARPSRLPFSASRRKPVSQTEWFHQWFGRDAQTRTRDARAPSVRPSQTAFGRVGWVFEDGQPLSFQAH